MILQLPSNLFLKRMRYPQFVSRFARDDTCINQRFPNCEYSALG